MSTSVILSCPFCHQKAEYRDAPPNSTVRCHECGSVFRVPANAHGKHKPGTVLKGEHAGGGMRSKKWIVVVVLLAVIGGASWYLYANVFKTKPIDYDTVFDKVANYPLYDAQKMMTPEGVAERFVLSWQQGDLDMMMHWARLEDKAKVDRDADAAVKKAWMEKLQSVFGIYKLTKHSFLRFQPEGQDIVYYLAIEGQDARTGSAAAPLKGTMKVRVSPNKMIIDGGKTQEVWGVDVMSAVPVWES